MSDSAGVRLDLINQASNTSLSVGVKPSGLTQLNSSTASLSASSGRKVLTSTSTWSSNWSNDLPRRAETSSNLVISSEVAAELTRQQSTEAIAIYQTMKQSFHGASAIKPAAPAAASAATASTDKSKKGTTADTQKAKDFKMDEHQLSAEEVCTRFNSVVDLERPRKSTGFSDQEAARLLQIHGKNKLSPPKQVPEIVKFLMHMANLFMVLLEVAGILCFIAYSFDTVQSINLYVGIVLWGIVIITSLVSYLQDKKSSALMDSFKNLLPQQCTVIRNGAEKRVNAEDLVPGDIIMIAFGSKVPADLRVLSSSGLKVDNSSLTGENEPQSRKPTNKHANPLEAENIVWYGTLVVDGEGVGVVVRTGDHTLIGQIASLAATTDASESTLQLEIKNFVKKIALLGVAMGVIFLILGFIITPNVSWVVNVINMIGVIVANVPEGLPATVTACLTITAKRLAAKCVFVKRLDVIETLGSVSVIASDKTGTLTENRMTVSHLWYDNQIKHNDTVTKDGKFSLEDPSCFQLVRAAALCNRSVFEASTADDPDVNKRLILGDASESAFMRLCEVVMPTVQTTRDAHPKIFEIPFNSAKKYQMSIHMMDGAAAKKPVLLIKGAPEVILGFCPRYIVKEGKIVARPPEFDKQFSDANDGLASFGERCLGFALGELTMEDVDGEMTEDRCLKLATDGRLAFLGIISLQDPPRAAVPGAIKDCHTAGIRVIMVTGDQPPTAKAIGKQIGLITMPTVEDLAKERGVDVKAIPDAEVNAVVIHGINQIHTFQQEDWDRILSKKEVIFARTTPQHKLMIVEQLQRRGEVVVVTGDGVNDSPALKQANVGCAMGLGGSEVAKEAADIILMDDNFASIVNGIEEGRAIFDNLRKSIAYTLGHLAPEMIPFLISVITGIPNGLSAVLILLIDLGTEMFPAVSLAYEEPEGTIMLRKPRNVATDRLVSASVFFYSYLQVGVIECVACYTGYLYLWPKLGYTFNNLYLSGADYFRTDSKTWLGKTGNQQVNDLAVVQASWFLVLVICQFFHIFATKTRFESIFTQGIFSNRQMNYGVLVEIGIAIFLVYVPPVQIGLQTGDVPGEVWGIAIAFGVYIVFYNEVRRWFIRKYPENKYVKWFAW